MKPDLIIVGDGDIGKTTLSDRIQHQFPDKEVVIIEEGTLEDFSKKQLKQIEFDLVKLKSNIYDTPMSGKQRRRERRKDKRKNK